MPFEIVLDGLPAGYALEAAKQGDSVTTASREFVSSEDGDHFVSRLEGFPDDVFAQLPAEIKDRHPVSTIDHLLAIIRRDRTATVYLNELNFRLRVRVKRGIQAGEAITNNDIADVEKLSFAALQIPPDAGLIFVFSIGWRKGLFYDFVPLADAAHVRDYDLDVLLGRYYAYLGYQHLFKISTTEWQKFFDQRWFPFVTLTVQTVKKMLSRLRSQWQIDELLDEIALEVLGSTDAMLERWSNAQIFRPHFDLLQRAVDRYQHKDFISATSILYPRIEGIMRSLHRATNSGANLSQKALAASVINARPTDNHEQSLLLPKMFLRFLEDIYFANFTPDRPAVVSRNSVAHGIAITDDFSLKSATLGLLIVDQIFFFSP